MWHSLMLSGKIIILIYQSLSLVIAEPLRGSKMDPVNIPFIASIGRKLPDGRNHFCTGSLITKNLVLTVTHCLKDIKYHEVDVMIGATNLSSAQPKYDVQSWITFDVWAAKDNPDMIKFSKNDIAIMKLGTQVEQPGVTLANITTLRNTELYGKNAAVVGWVVEKGSKRRRILMKANVQILTADICERRYHLVTNQFVSMPKGQLCTAGNPLVIVTKGDSGGPLLDENNNILGITRSFCPDVNSPSLHLYNCTEGFADEYRFNLHTDFIDEYRQFIEDSKIHL